MAKIRNTQTEQRHQDIIDAYNERLKAHGEYASRLTRQDICGEVAKLCRCSPEHVARLTCVRKNKKKG